MLSLKSTAGRDNLQYHILKWFWMCLMLAVRPSWKDSLQRSASGAQPVHVIKIFLPEEYIHHYKPTEVNKALSRGGTFIFGSLTICSFLLRCLSLSTVCFYHKFLLCDAKQIFCKNLGIWSRQPGFHRRNPSHWSLNTDLVNASASIGGLLICRSVLWLQVQGN